jgi:hypothetical protein
MSGRQSGSRFIALPLRGYRSPRAAVAARLLPAVQAQSTNGLSITLRDWLPHRALETDSTCDGCGQAADGYTCPGVFAGGPVAVMHGLCSDRHQATQAGGGP